MNQQSFLRSLFDEAVRVADPMICVPAHLPPKPDGKLLVIGAGKASARMGEALESVWGPCEGLIITRYGYERPLQGVTLKSASHPVPDEAGLRATRELRALLNQANKDTFILALISGGGSSLMIEPAGDMTLEDKMAVNAALLTSGAPIDEMNVVRKHLSRIKGGQLAAAAYPATLHTLMISDVPGDDPAYIASGPTVGDSSTPADAQAIIKRYGIDVPASAEAVLNDATGVITPGDERLSTTTNTIIAAPSQSLEAAKAIAEKEGVNVTILGDALEGEARDLAREQGALVLKMQSGISKPHLLLSGGECTVTRTGDGIGGPNAEYALSLAIALDGAPGIHALACDTDGVDGAAEVAGAMVAPETLARARAKGIDPQASLTNNDAHSFFASLEDQVSSGPTLTNVNDFRAILIEPT
ncbi:glycerate kinase [Ahrensia marina]|uniref:glycerate kinase type-2 family protein n=1 Tax=Ahrensia marina TaxID=1514904 RepID=UPI0035CE948E